MLIDLILMVLKLLGALAIVLVLLLLTLKVGASKVTHFQKGKYIKILDKATLSKDNSLFVVKLGEEGCVIATSENKVEILKNLTKVEVETLEREKEKLSEEILNKYNHSFEKLKSKLNIRK